MPIRPTGRPPFRADHIGSLLRFVPMGKGVVLGLISSKVPALEPLDLLRRRVDEAQRHVDLDRLAVSPQSGFASTVAGNPVTEADELAKLARVVDAAQAIWGSN
jgi:5-methyltetrahydropteroyltriglutamate--homocysteine methyltransferase